jgi:ribosome biogenesis GTPase / thiamine phosphate phosphatase
LKKGLILKSTGSWYTVKTEDGQILPCKIKGKLRTFDFKSTNPVAVGDIVTIELADDTVGVITDIAERKNYIIRRSSNLSKQTHILAANIDQAILVVTLIFPETSFEFIDRFLAGAEAYRIPVKIVVNKTDLYEDTLSGLLKELHQTYEPIGYPVIETSVVKNKNIDTLGSLLQGKTSLFSGNSGVGKSSLINAVYPEVQLRTGEISDYHMKGKHTTTFAEMVELPDGSYLIDTPGIKGFGMVNMKREEIYHFFPEIFETSSACQYHNCLHLTEPKCAVRTAVDEGKISASRYHSYANMMADENERYRN